MSARWQQLDENQQSERLDFNPKIHQRLSPEHWSWFPWVGPTFECFWGGNDHHHVPISIIQFVRWNSF
jgi:hypothetical protein